jgi:radical SAM-linked protein
VSVSTHVPKPHTPFQWCALDGLPEIRRKQALLRHALGSQERQIALRCHDGTTTYLEGVFARGDRQLGEVLERAFLRGACFDSWEDQLRLDLWEEAFAFFGIQTERYLGTLPTSARLPWDHFDIGLERGFLAKEYRKALQNRLSPPCGKAAGMFIHHTNVADAHADQRRLVCYDCGVACDLTQMRSERIGFLEEMGAREPTQRRTSLPLLAATAPLRKHASAPERVRPPQPGEHRARIRLSFEKLGPAALLGHLDFTRELGRVIRRAGLRPAYSQGFRPKPRFTFGPALALGVASLDEKIDVDLIDPPRDSTELLQRLNSCSGAGLRFIEAARLEQNACSLGTAVIGARYLVLFAEAVLDAGTLAAKVAEFLQHEKILVKRSVKGIGRLIDVRSKVFALRLGDETARARAAAAGLAGRLTCLVADVELGPAGSVKPHEIVEALLGTEAVPHQVLRDALLLGPATSVKPDVLVDGPRSEPRQAARDGAATAATLPTATVD